MRSNSSCIIRCTLDNMFRNSKHFSGSPPQLQYDAGSLRASSDNIDAQALPALQPRTSSNDDHGLPKCRQFLNTDAHSRLYTALDHSSQDLNACFSGRGSKSIEMQCPNVNVHIDPEISTLAASYAPASSSREIREYDFLRCMEEEAPRPVLAHEDVDCTLQLGTVSASTMTMMCDRNVAASTPQELSSSMLDLRALSSKQQFLADRLSMLPSFGREAQHNGLRGSEFVHANMKEYNAGTLHWGSSSFITRNSTLDGTCMSPTLLRENTHDIDECGSSSRTSSNSSGNTMRGSTGMSRPREIGEAYLSTTSTVSASLIGPPKQWFQDSLAGVLASTKLGGSGNDGYRNLAASLAGQGGAFTTNVLAGACKGSNSKEASSYVIRICAQCKTMRTPLWRNGPQGPKSLCNACGIRYKKEERRSAAAEDGKLLLHLPPDTSDHRSRSSSMDRADDRRPTLSIQDQRSRFCNDNRRPRLTPDTLDDDQRPKFVDSVADEPSRFLAAREKRPKLVNDSYRSS